MKIRPATPGALRMLAPIVRHVDLGDTHGLTERIDPRGRAAQWLAVFDAMRYDSIASAEI